MDREAKAVMRKCGTTFALGARLLPEPQRSHVAELYALCREIDDIADSGVARGAKPTLRAIRDQIAFSQPSGPAASAFGRLSDATGLSSGAALDLVDGVAGDLDHVRVADEPELLRYGYRVAGTVGLMMCDVLGATATAARAHAVDLGIGMQLTNIARDVLEDAQRERRYLPGTWAPFEPAEIINPSPATEQRIREAILRTLDLADRFYASGFRGLRYLPIRARFAVAVAGSVYREIGARLRMRDADYLAGRMVVPQYRRVAVAAGAIASALIRNGERSGHDRQLHASFGHLMRGAGHAS